MLTLADLKPGEFAEITKIQDGTFYLKLLEMGCLPGEKIIIKQKAPFGDPISVQIAGYQLSLRLIEAQSIVVKKI